MFDNVYKNIEHYW